jgi:hypothetical protein
MRHLMQLITKSKLYHVMKNYAVLRKKRAPLLCCIDTEHQIQDNS